MAARFAASLFPLLVTPRHAAPRRAAPHVALGCTALAKPVVVPRDEATALSRAALDTLEREACPSLLTRAFPTSEPRGTVSTGRL